MIKCQWNLLGGFHLSFSPTDYFALDNFEHAALFEAIDYVWEALGRLDTYAPRYARSLIEGTVAEGAWLSGAVYIAPGAVVEPGAYVQGPTMIGPNTVVRHGAYVRGYCVIGAECVIGHATEVKRSIFLDGAQAPHFNYVGDSILGRGVNLGAGTKTSNLKNDAGPIVIRSGDEEIPTGLQKLGAIVGDGVHTGCNCVTSPGTLIGPDSHVYPCTVLRGVYPSASIIKMRQHIEIVSKQN